MVGQGLNSGGVATLGRHVKKGVCSHILIGQWPAAVLVAVVMTSDPSYLQWVGHLSQWLMYGIAMVTKFVRSLRPLLENRGMV